MFYNFSMAKKRDKIIKESPWIPFQYPIFKMLWIASVVSGIGTWMQDVGAAWLMTSLTTNPLMVASVQAVTSFSVFLFILPAGALADIIDKRRYLIVLQAALMFIAAIFALLTFFGKIVPSLLLFLTFILGMGGALSFPAWQVLMAEMVPAKHLPSAVALTGLSINISRAIGPAIAGFMIAALGPAAVFAFNSVSFFGIILTLYLWRHPFRESPLPAERFYGAMRAGLRYLWGSPSLQILLIKSCAFFVFASSVWALLPLIARVHLQKGAMGYGILFALLGLGAVFGTMFLPYFREKFNCDQRVLLGSICFALNAVILVLSKNFYLACGGMILGGVGWMMVLSTLTALVQQVVASWVRARSVSIFLAIFFGGMSVGSLLWGWIATHYSIPMALFVSAFGLIVANFLTYLLISGEQLIVDHTPSGQLPAPVLEAAPRFEEGPIMVTVEYTIDPEDMAQFTQAIRDLRRVRMRDGAFFWSLFKDIENPTKVVECFMIESWLEHLRQHERISVSDWEIQQKVSVFHKGKTRPRITHYVAQKLKKSKLK
jgi:MFS family permease